MSTAATVEGLVVGLLLVNTELTALIGNRIHPSMDPQNIVRPKLTYQRISTNRSVEVGAFSNDGPTGLAIARIQFDAWADSLLTAKAVATAVRHALNGYARMFQPGMSAHDPENPCQCSVEITEPVEGIGVGCIAVTQERELPATIYEGQGKPIQRVMIEVSVSYTDT